MKKTKTAVLASVAVAGGVTVTGLFNTAQADTVLTGNVSQQLTAAQQLTATSQTAYQQKASQNEEQLSKAAASNAVTEQSAATSYAAANSADEASTNAQISDIQSAQAQAKQAAAPQIAKASDAVQKQTEASIQNINDQAAQATKAQTAANTAVETKMQSDNAAQVAQAQEQAKQAAANAQAAINKANEELNVAKSNAQAEHDATIKAANDAYDTGKSNADANYTQQKQAIQNDATAAQNAVNQAQADVKSHTTTTTEVVKNETTGHKAGVIDATVLGYGPWDASQWNRHDFYATMYGEYAGADFRQMANGDKLDYSKAPHQISELPADFKPGLLVYDSQNDHSEAVAPTGLTDAQKATLRAFMTNWTNGFRNWVYNNDRPVYDNVTENNEMSGDAPAKIRETTLTDKWGDEIGKARENARLNNHTHSVKQGVDYTKIVVDKLGEEYQKMERAVSDKILERTPSEMPAYTVTYSPNVAMGENLMTLSVPKPTMLAYLTYAYNMMQAMYYGEIYNDTPGHIEVGGHTANVLRSESDLLAIAFEKLDNSTDVEGGLFDDIPAYAVTFDFGCDTPYIAKTTGDDYRSLSRSKIAELNDPDVNELISQMHNMAGDEVHEPVFEQFMQGGGTHTVTHTNVPQQYTDALNKAKAHLADVQNNMDKRMNDAANAHNANLDNLAKAKEAAIQKANTTFNKAVKDATKAHDDKVAEAKGSMVRVETLKKELDAKYQQLVKEDQDKLATIETKRQADIKDAKAKAQDQYKEILKKYGIDDSATQAKINALLKNHEDFVKANADKLAQLKHKDAEAYNALKLKLDTELAALLPKDNHNGNTEATNNVIHTGNGNHTIILPAQKPIARNNYSAKAVVNTATAIPVAPTSIPALVPATMPLSSQNSANSNITSTTTPAAAKANAKKAAKKDKTDSKAAKGVNVNTTANKTTKSDKKSPKINKSSMSIIGLIAVVVLGALGISISSKKQKN